MVCYFSLFGKVFLFYYVSKTHMFILFNYFYFSAEYCCVGTSSCMYYIMKQKHTSTETEREK